MSNVFQKYGVFLIIPAIVMGFSLLLKSAAGPYWLAPNFDPSYQYLVNGLYLVKGFVPNHADHPGTPLQILCCAVCWFFNIGRSASEIVTNVLISPEFYLRIVFVILTLFSFFTSFGLGVYVFRKTNDKLAAVLAQLPPLSFLVLKSWETFEPVLPVVANVFPETLLMGVLNLFNICLLMYFFARTSKDESVAALFWGLVAGLGVAVKITFIPVLLIPLIILSWKNRLFFVGAFVAAFVVWTLPVLSKYPIIWGWISSIAMHKGPHILLAGLTLATVAIVLWKLITKEWDRVSLFLTVTMIGALCQFLTVTQHPGAHYLLPGLGLCSAVFVLFYLKSLARRAWGRKIALVFIFVFIFLGVWQATRYYFRLKNFTQGILSFHDQTSSKYPNCIFIDYYRSSDPQAALYFGDAWNLAPRLGKELFGLYPNKYFFHLWGNQIMSFNGRVWSNDLLAQNPCVLFRGDGKYNFSDGPFEMQLLEKGRFESIHLLTGTTEKQAAIFISVAMHFFQAGEYAKARACVLQARRLHYQPDSSIESLIKLFEPYLQH